MNAFRRWLLMLVLTTVALEIVLQVGSVVAWVAYSRPNAAVIEDNAVRVLCVGDSWTFGVGSSHESKSYPAQLEAICRERDPQREWSVTNAGWPGRNSREVLEVLPGLLEDIRPRVLCVIIGTNDRWSRPEELVIEQAEFDGGSAYRFRWRIPRFIAWLCGKFGEAPGDAAEDLPGDSLDPPPDPPRPAEDQPPSRETPRAYEEADRLGEAALHAGDYAAVERHYLDALESLPDDPMAMRRIVSARVRQVNREGALEMVERLRALFDASPDRWVGEALLEALREVGDAERTLEYARICADSFPRSAVAWGILGWETFQAGDAAEGRAALERALECWNPNWQAGHWHAWLARVCKLGLGDVRAATRSVVALYLLSASPNKVKAALLSHTYDLDIWREVVAAVECSDAQRAELTEIGERILGGGLADPSVVLAKHLTRICRLAQASGARVVLGSYAHRGFPGYEKTVENVANECDVPFVPNAHVFEEQLRTRDRDELLAPDGHANDAGYRIIAELMADAVLRAL